jgi:benzaldehyde dehydrogenase (NAD)
VVGVISPFNFPLILSMRAVAPALAAGNAVILKPDPQTPISGGYIIAHAFHAAGLPEGVLQVLPGGAEAGSALCSAPEIRMIAFTGSTATGRRVAEAAGKHLKKVALELGGKSPLIVLDDADPEVAASNAAWGAFLHQGQICMASGRIFVHQKIAADFTRRLVEHAGRLPVGNPATEQVAIGPLINESQRDKVHAIVTESVEAGAKLEIGGEFDRLFYKPTVLTNVKPGMRAFNEEVFGPVANVITFSSDEEVIAMANDTEYGLSSGIIAHDLARAQRIGDQLNSGMLHINDQTVNDECVNPFGGCGCSGNGGNIGGPANWENFSQLRWITVQGDAHAYPF